MVEPPSETNTTECPVGVEFSSSSLIGKFEEVFQDHVYPASLREAMELIGSMFAAKALVCDIRQGPSVHGVEWVADGFGISKQFQEVIQSFMGRVLAAGDGQCIHTRTNEGNFALTTALVRDDQGNQVGVMTMILPVVDSLTTRKVLWQFELTLGEMSLWFNPERSVDQEELDEVAGMKGIERRSEAAVHPVRLAFSLAADLKNRYCLEQTAVGFVRGNRVDVMAICGLDELRKTNPGVKLIRAAMEECLDRGEDVLFLGRASSECDAAEDYCHLHGQWSAKVRNESVASIPLKVKDETVAIVSMLQRASIGIRRDEIKQWRDAAQPFANLITLSRLASRGLCKHILQETKVSACKFLQRRILCRTMLLVMLVLSITWFAFGSLNHQLIVPATVVADHARKISVTNAGVLLEFMARPGDQVRKGQLLARLDSSQDQLHLAHLQAKFDVIEAQTDQAIAVGPAEQIQILRAQKDAILVAREIIKDRIKRSSIVAPCGGLIIKGDLRSRVGSWMDPAEVVMEIAPNGVFSLALGVPAELRDQQWKFSEGAFRPGGAPQSTISFSNLKISSAATVEGGHVVFPAEALLPISSFDFRAGMTGNAILKMEPRPVWWALVRGISRWFTLRLWI